MEEKYVNGQKLMTSISNGELVNYDKNMFDADKLTTQVKIFLLAQARRELERVVKLTDFLDNLESHYMDKINNSWEEVSLKEYPTVIATISASLKRSSDILQSVVKDDSLTSLFLIDNSTKIGLEGENRLPTLDLKTSKSRENVRNIVSMITKAINVSEDKIKKEGEKPIEATTTQDTKGADS
jgi:hypothetical protein